MRKPADSIETLLVNLPLDYTYGRSILAGVLEAVRDLSGIRVQLVRSRREMLTSLKRSGRLKAVIGMIWDSEACELLHKQTPLVISFANRPPYPADRHVLLKDTAIGTLAANAFQEAGREQMAVYNPEGDYHSNQRATGFGDTANRPVQSFVQIRDCLEWVRQSNEPVGIMAVNDVHARELTNALEDAGVAIPGEAAVIGVDDDEVYVHLGRYALSSIQLPFQEMGRLAVRMAVQKGPGADQPLVELSPTGIIHRDTTTSNARFPSLVRRYLEFIQRERPLPSSVGEACLRAAIQRRSLEIACRDALKNSPANLLRQERLRLARQMVRQGIRRQEIAHELGYAQVKPLRKLLEADGEKGG